MGEWDRGYELAKSISRTGKKSGISFFLKNKAVYTAESVACDWAGAVMQKKPPKKRRKTKCVADRPKDRHSEVQIRVHATKNDLGRKVENKDDRVPCKLFQANLKEI